MADQGKQPNLSAVQWKHLLSRYDAGEHMQAERAEMFNVSRTTVYREIQRRSATAKPTDGHRHLSRRVRSGPLRPA